MALCHQLAKVKVNVANTVPGEAIQWLEGDGQVSEINVRVRVKFVFKKVKAKEAKLHVESESEHCAGRGNPLV